MNKDFLSNLTEEIDRRKIEKDSISTKLGENTQSSGISKDTFLSDLLSSVKKGQIGESAKIIGAIENTVAKNMGEEPKMKNVNVSTTPKTVSNGIQNALNTTQQSTNLNIDREEQMFNDFKKKNQTLAEAIGGFKNNLQQKPLQEQVSPNYNNGNLNESVAKAAHNYMNENFNLLFEETMKNAILEIYAAERIKKVLQENTDLIENILLENEDLIKGVVIKVIKEIKARSATKTK